VELELVEEEEELVLAEGAELEIELVEEEGELVLVEEEGELDCKEDDDDEMLSVAIDSSIE
jgi:hypothetical protein